MMDILVYIFLYLISVWFAFRVGWKAREVHAMRLVNRMVEVAEEVQEGQKDSIRVIIEKHNDKFFVYNMEDHTFMAQGTDKEELESNLVARYPGKKFEAKEENLIDMGFLGNESV